MKYFYNGGSTLITGGAGFIGSYLTETLAKNGFDVTALDNLSTGKLSNLVNCENLRNFKFLNKDLGNLKETNFLNDIETVFHFAADPEVRTSYQRPEDSFKQNIRNTFLLLQKIRKSNIKKIVFASSSSIYGDAKILPTPENYGPLLPISAYGASKLACEAMVSSFCYNYGINGIIIRPANIIGARGRHGLIWDLVHKLKKDKTKLEVLGDGKQIKSFIHISDGITGIFQAVKGSKQRVEIFNLGSVDSIEIIKVAKLVRRNMKLDSIKIVTSGGVDGGRGWKGDIKKAHLDVKKLRKLGWKSKLTSLQAANLTSKEIIKEVIHRS